MRIAIIAALPGELKHLVSTGFTRLPTARGSGVRMWQAEIGGAEVVAVCAGMGPNAARRAFTAAEHAGSLDMVLSIGWAGALVDSAIAGSTSIFTTVVDAQTGERYQLADGSRKLVLVSTPHVALREEKHRLAASYAGAAVDMESATILRLAQMRGIPAGCFKAISDDLEQELPDFNQFIAESGQMQMLRFLAHVLPRPNYWASLIRLGRASSQGSKTLASAVLTFLAGPKDLATVNRTGNVT
jgi:adenosylhomocysteine nucleosidase